MQMIVLNWKSVGESEPSVDAFRQPALVKLATLPDLLAQ